MKMDALNQPESAPICGIPQKKPCKDSDSTISPLLELSPSQVQLKNFILNLQEPVVFKNKLDWDLLNWSLEDWGKILKDRPLDFRCGKHTFTQKPQWERTTSLNKATFSEFLQQSQSENTDWMYFDYKYLKEWLQDNEELKKNIKWDKFGFGNMTSEDSTIWIGSKGAHTPCHIDSYGCNLIAQCFGRKQWLLFPSKVDLKPTRVPYEESSIYSQLNFFSPTMSDFQDVQQCKQIILEPGDVLFVPHQWWHYVENLDTAVSVNVWLPLPQDDERRLEESLVQLFISRLTIDLDVDIRNQLVNPNFDEDFSRLSLEHSLDLVSVCKEKLENSGLNNDWEKSSENPQCLSNQNFFTKYLNLHTIPVLSQSEFLIFLDNQRQRFLNILDNKVENEDVEEIANIINAVTSSDVISLIKKKILK